MLAIHLLLCLIALLAGIVQLIALCSGRHYGKWAGLLLSSTALVSVTGLLLPSPLGTPTPDPARILSVLELIVVMIATFTLFRLQARAARISYIVATVLAVYLNVFVAVTQAFLKIPLLHTFAPTGKEPVALTCQLVVLMLFGMIGNRALTRAAHRVAVA